MHARHVRVLLVILAIATLSYGAGTSIQKAKQRGPFWDVDYYRAAAERYGDRSDPYLSNGSPTGYYYSASILGALALVFRDFETQPVYVTSMGLGILGALALAIGALYRRSAPLLLCLLYTLALGNGQALYLFVSGNLTWLAGLLKAVSLVEASRGQWRAFYLIVGMAALIKPDALVLLVLPFALRALSPWFTLAVLPTAIDALLSHWLWPGAIQNRWTAIWVGIGEPLQLRYSLAGGLSRVLARDGGLDVGMATAAGVCAQLAICATLAWLLRRREPSDEPRAFALATVVALSASPRLASYDAFLFGPAVFFAFWPGVESEPIALRDGLPMLLLITCLFKEGLVLLPVLLLAWLIRALACAPSR